MSGESDLLSEECHSAGEISCNLSNVRINLKNGLFGDDDVYLSYYLTAYKELYNFFVILGGAFQFVATDVKTKIKIIEDLQNAEKSQKNNLKNFLSVKSMILHEKEESLLNDSSYVSGSRTLLRLHRGIDFVRRFFLDIYRLEDNAKIGGICRECYDKTLANYHTWVVRNSARLAMKLLPTREALMERMANNNPELISQAMNEMPDLLDQMGNVYDRIQKLYSYYELLNLP